jgi:23S rRNA pseudouridine1911/1915/1917 synthase
MGCYSMREPDVRQLTVDRDGERLDLFVVRKLPELTRSRVRKLIDEGLVTVDGRRPAKAGLALEAGQRVHVTLPAPDTNELQPEPLPLRIVYEDDDLLVVDKPAGMPVHPSAGHSSHTLVNALLAHSPELSRAGDRERPGIVHRLDKDTSGLIIVAKNDAAHVALARALKERRVEKTYIALVEGRLEPHQGVIDAPVARHPVQRKKMAVVAGGRESRTRYNVLREIDGYSLVELHPETGRTHQLRVHLASIGHPVAGDRVYGRTKRPGPFPRQFLHAQRLAFAHPTTGARVEVEAELAEDLKTALAALE